ncbi:MAG TPA: FGGY family carbohydrate kinase, partial [Dehalococcoidia bacterium]|nr:FGGY family carbohydrate kinase [Dehalococcoidia bacterium]
MSPAFSTRRTAGPPGERAGRPGTAYFLALDAGTSGARCVIVDETGSLLATAVRPWSYVAPADDTPYGREFSPSLFWEALCEVSREALARSGLSASAVAAVSTTGQRLGIVLLDGEGREMFASPNLDARALIQGL